MSAWMLFSALFALLVTLSARAAEAAARDYDRPVRWIWLSGLAVSALAPALVWVTGVRWPGILPWGNGSAGTLLPSWLSDVSTGASSISLDSARDAGFPFDPIARVLWVALSLAALLWFCWAWRRLGQARASWHPAVLREQRVLLSAASGPAVIGLYRPSIVVPKWVLTETASVQRMILLHEQEHARAGDHVLLAFAPLLLVALPWNLPLWWQVKRLRLAIELDCDARVLRHGVCAREYGTLLLELAGAHGSTAIAGASLVEPRTFLERRILAMSSQHSPYRLARAAAAGAAAVLLAIAACESTTGMTPDRGEEPAVEAEVSFKEVVDVPVQEQHGRGALYIVDGVRVGRHGDKLALLDHVSVGTVEVLKGAEAVARYGAEGAAGVIIVTTQPRTPKPPMLLERAGEELKASVELRAEYSPEYVEVPKEKRAFNVVKPDGETGATAKAYYVETPVEVMSERALTATEAVSIRGKLQLTSENERTSITGDEIKLSVDAAATKPLILIDGREVRDFDLSKLDPNRIQEISILKGAAAAARFGEKGRNGVILILTKQDGP